MENEQQKPPRLDSGGGLAQAILRYWEWNRRNTHASRKWDRRVESAGQVRCGSCGGLRSADLIVCWPAGEPVAWQGNGAKDEPSPTSPAEWARSLPAEVWRAIKELGDWAIHPNDGNVTVQARADEDLLELVEAAFGFLLYRVYEARAHEKALAAKLTAAASKTKPPGPKP